MMDIKSIKNELRMYAHDTISALPDEYFSESDNRLFHLTTSLSEFTNARNIMLYFSVKREPNTHGIAEAALMAGKTVAFPYCFRGGIMQARTVRSLDELQPAMFGIPAPAVTAPVIRREELDLIIVPALVFDKGGYRIGSGGGYYDRYLPGIRAFTVGLGRERLFTDELPREPHDIAVDCVVTEYGLRKWTVA